MRGASDAAGREPSPARLAVLKALGDNTRYAIYLELARAQSPRSTADIAESLGLHPNTIRPHLERMRDVGLLQVEADAKGSVGRPQHRYSLAPGAPALGLEPPAFPVLSKMLVQLAHLTAALPDEAATAGAEQGRALAASRAPARGPHADRACAKALTAALDELGFDPVAGDDGDTTTIAFTHCPYRELAEAFPEVVCHLHRGLIEGFVEQMGGAGVERFRTLADRDPCQVELSARVSS
jgi:predicted ArsR family transcriptional regulator